MNIIPYNLNYQDGLNTYPIIDYIDERIASGGGTSAISSNVYTQSSNLYITNSNVDGNIYFKTNGSTTTTGGATDYAVKIDSTNGKLYLYHKYDLLNPLWTSGYYDVINEVIGLKSSDVATGLELATLTGFVEGQIATIEDALAGLATTDIELAADIVREVKRLDGRIDPIEAILTDTTLREDLELSQEVNTSMEVTGQAINRINNKVQYNIGSALQWGIGVAGVTAFGYLVGSINNMGLSNTIQYSSNPLYDTNPQLRRNLKWMNDSNQAYNTSNFLIASSNSSIEQGFINSNVIIAQKVPTLKSDKVMLGNITTPNVSYQLEMTGNLNANEYYRNSTSLTSLLAQKQDNITAVSPMYLTTGNIGLNYDNTLLNNSGSLGVSIGAESKWAFTGANIYNKTMTNVGIGTDRGLTYKLNVVGDSYFSSNVNIAISKLNFISSYTGQSAFGLVTGANEYYIQYTGNGTLVLNEPCACDLLIVGAGGNGGTGASSGGGGAGEVIYYPNFPLRSGTLNITIGTSSTTPSNRITKINHSSGDQISAKGGGNGGTSVFYSTSGGTVSSLTAISGTNDAYISITAGTTLTLNANCSADILVIGGGGGGGRWMGGGGGAGGVVYQTNVNLNSGNYSITIGNGGTGSTATTTFSGVAGGAGGDSFIQSGGSDLIINSITYRGKGGGGGGDYASATGNGTGSGAGGAGGSGGGGNAYENPRTGGTANQGNTYFNGSTNVAGGYNGATGISGFSGGGGGAGGVGGGGSGDQNMQGGVGVQLSITGTASWYAGGGGGAKLYGANALNNGIGGLGGSGVGGDGNASEDNTGDYNYIAPRHNGTDGTGSGGGGGAYGQNSAPPSTGGGTGGSGVVIIRFKNYLSIIPPTSGGSGGGGAKSQIGAVAGVKFDDYKSLALAGLNGTSTTGGNGGTGNTTYGTRYTTTITGTSLSVGLGGSGVTATPASPATKTNYGDGGDGNGGTGYQGIVIIRFKEASSHLQLKAIKDNGNTGLILNANESPNSYQLRVYPWSDTYQLTGIATRGWSMRVHDGNNNLDLLNLFSSFGGRIGIKTKNPSATLDVNGDIACKTFSVVGTEQYGITCQVINQDVIGEASINISAGSSGNYGAMSVVYLPSENLGYINCSKSLQIKTQSVGSYIHIDNSTGYVGIGNNLPQAKLHVDGTILASSVSVTTVNADSVAAGNISCTSLDLNNGSIIDCNRLNSVDVYTGPVKCTSINLQGGNVTNGGTFYGMAQQSRFLVANVNEWHYSQDNRNRFYFTDDTVTPSSSHTVFRTGSLTHYFQDKDGTDYCLLDRFGISTYFEVISGGAYDNVGVADGVSSGVYVYRRMILRLSTFTEVHRCFCEDELYINYDDFINEFVGRIVVSKGTIKTALKKEGEDWEIFEGKDGVTIDDSHPIIELSRKKKDKKVIGVITKRNQNNDIPNRLVINSLGEGAVWVINTNGNFEAGDFIQTSDEIGYGERQDDDINHNYSLGKVMIDCNFELDNPNYKCEVIDEVRDLRRAFVPCFYYSG